MCIYVLCCYHWELGVATITNVNNLTKLEVMFGHSRLLLKKCFLLICFTSCFVVKRKSLKTPPQRTSLPIQKNQVVSKCLPGILGKKCSDII